MKEHAHSKKLQIWNGFPKTDKNLLIISFSEKIRLAHRRINLRLVSSL